MSDLLHFRRHRFDALHALLLGDARKAAPDCWIGSNHLRRDIGLNEIPNQPTPRSLAAPMIGLRR